MKKKVSVLLLAMGMVTVPLTAKPSLNYQPKTDATSNHQKRIASTLKRLSRKKAELEFIRESDKEINKALAMKAFRSGQAVTTKEAVTAPQTILAAVMPAEGVDISDEFKRLQGKSKSS